MENYAWPLVALILGGVGLVTFRAPLTRFIDRWKSLKIAGTGVDTVPNGQMSQGTRALESGEAEPAKPIELDAVFGMALLSEYESAINTAMQQRHVAEDSKQDDLVRQLAQQMIAYRFEQTYHLIYGSQLTALSALNTMTQPVEVSLFRPPFNKVAAENPTTYADSSFERWIGFLTARGLVTLVGDKIAISVAGREFLKFLMHQGYTMKKFL